MPDTVRQSAQARLGSSFAGVRVHADADAARMAASAGAQAFTLGRHLVFGLGRYQPSTQAGAALLWHELAHVPAARDTATMLRAPLYRTEDLVFSPPQKGVTEAQMHKELDAKAKKTPPDITGWNIKGASPTDDAYIFLQTALFEFGRSDRWNSGSRLEMAIGWAMPVPGVMGMTPIGLVTITIDAAGVATAELVSPAGPTLSPSISAADGVAKLKADFGVDLVAGDKTWSDSDTGDVVQALGLLKPSDRAALKGVQIIRVSTLPKGHSGEFNAGGGVASGATTVQSLPTLKLADSAFPKHRFALGPTGGTPLPVPASEQTVLHEVGHAVEEAIARAALEKADTAVIRQNVAKNNLDAAIDRAKKAKGTPDAQKAHDDAVKSREAYDAAANAASAAKAARSATLVPASVIKPLQADVTAKKTAYDGAKATAVAAMSTASADEAADSLTYRSAVDALASSINDYVAKAQPNTDLGPLDDALAAGRAARDKARINLASQKPTNPALGQFGPVEAAQNAWADAARALGHTQGRTRRLQKFVDLVKASGITPVTKYAQDNWPDKPEEFYAETYSLWLIEPDFLKSNYPDLFNFFDSGDYAK